MLLRFQQVPNLKSCYYLRLEGKIGCWSCFGPVALVVLGYSSGPVGSCESGPFRRLLAMAALPRVLYRNPANGLDVLSLPPLPAMPSQDTDSPERDQDSNPQETSSKSWT